MPSNPHESVGAQRIATSAPTDWRPLLACCLATFVLLAYTTIVTVSAATIADDVDAGFALSQWIIDVYTLGLAALVLAMGTLGDRLGHRRLFLTGLGAFGAASVACAVATSGGMLVVARAAQGVGGAAIFATAVPLLTQRYPGRTRGIAFAVWGAVAGAGSTVGTIAGGAVTQFVSWRWLFLGALPVCALAVAIGSISLARERPRRVRVDYLGTTLVTTAMAGVTYAVINGGENGWMSPGTIGGGVVALASICSFVPSQRRAVHPALPPSLFATREFTAVLLVGFAYYFAAFAALPVLAQWLQTEQAMSPLRAALVLTIQLVAFILVSLMVSARLHDAPRSWVLGGGTLLTGLACLTGAALLAWPDWTTVIAMLAVTGIGAGIVSPVLPAVAAASVPPARAGTAAAAANAARQLGLTIGIALCGALSQTAHVRGSTTGGVVAALIACGAVALCGGAISALLLRPAEAVTE